MGVDAWSLITSIVFGLVGIFITYLVYRKTKKINYDLTTHTRNKAFSILRPGIIDDLQQLSKDLQEAGPDNQYFFIGKLRALAKCLSKIYENDFKLDKQQKSKIANLKGIINREEDITYRDISNDLNDIIAIMEGEDARDKQR